MATSSYIRNGDLKTCLICDGSWYVGDEKGLRRHRKRCVPHLAVLNAKPFEPVRPYAGGFYEFSAEISECPSRWSLIHVQHCALLFRREFPGAVPSEFWNPDSRGYESALAFIPVSNDSRMQGAAVVSMATGTPILAWVWIVPSMRKNGILTKTWNMLSARYGDFKIGGPYSAEMMSFLEHQKVAKERLVFMQGTMEPGEVYFVGSQAVSRYR